MLLKDSEESRHYTGLFHKSKPARESALLPSATGRTCNSTTGRGGIPGWSEKGAPGPRSCWFSALVFGALSITARKQRGVAHLLPFPGSPLRAGRGTRGAAAGRAASTQQARAARRGGPRQPCGPAAGAQLRGPRGPSPAPPRLARPSPLRSHPAGHDARAAPAPPPGSQLHSAALRACATRAEPGLRSRQQRAPRPRPPREPPRPPPNPGTEEHQTQARQVSGFCINTKSSHHAHKSKTTKKSPRAPRRPRRWARAAAGLPPAGDSRGRGSPLAAQTGGAGRCTVAVGDQAPADPPCSALCRGGAGNHIPASPRTIPVQVRMMGRGGGRINIRIWYLEKHLYVFKSSFLQLTSLAAVRTAFHRNNESCSFLMHQEQGKPSVPHKLFWS